MRVIEKGKRGFTKGIGSTKPQRMSRRGIRCYICGGYGHRDFCAQVTMKIIIANIVI